MTRKEKLRSGATFLVGIVVACSSSSRVSAATRDLPANSHSPGARFFQFNTSPGCHEALSHRGSAQDSLARGRYAEAEARLDAVVSACDVPEAPREVLAGALSELGAALYSQAKYTQAEPIFRRALVLWRQVSTPADEGLIVATTGLAATYQAQSKYREAEDLNASAVAAIDREHVKGSLVVAKLFSNYASVEEDLGKYDAAERLVQRGLAMVDTGPSDAQPAANSAVPGLLAILAHIQQQRGNYAASEKTFLRCLAMQEKLLGATHPLIAVTLNNLAALYIAESRYDNAVPLLNRALEITARSRGRSDPAYAEILASLALVAHKQHHLSQAERQFKEALAIFERTLGPNDRNTGNLLNNLADLYVDLKKYKDAKPLLQQAISIYERSGSTAHPDFSGMLQNLATVLQADHNFSGAAELLHRAIRIDEKALGPENPRIAADLSNEAVNLFRMHHRAEAEADLRRAIAICGNRPEAAAPLADSLENLAQLYWVEKRFRESEPLLRQAILILDRLVGPDDPRLLPTLELYSLLMRKLGNYAEAEQAQVRAMRIRVKRAIRES